MVITRYLDDLRGLYPSDGEHALKEQAKGDFTAVLESACRNYPGEDGEDVGRHIRGLIDRP